MNVAEFLTMGGYAVYVWPAFTIVGLTLGAQWWLAKRYEKKVYKAIKQSLSYTEL